MQRGPGGTVLHQRRGWDFGVHNTLQFLHENDSFEAACESARRPDASDPEDLYSGPYFQNLDRDTGRVWSGRAHSHDAGMYALGVLPHLLQLYIVHAVSYAALHHAVQVLMVGKRSSVRVTPPLSLEFVGWM